MKRRLYEDCELLSKSNLPFNEFRNCTILVTGATGLIGSLLIKYLLFFNKIHNLNIKILAVIRNIEKAKIIFYDYKVDSNLKYIICDLQTDIFNYEGDIDYIIHAAAITASKIMVSNPVETIRLSINSTDKLLALATEKKVKSFIYISSMEMYGDMGDNSSADEKKLGYINLQSVRSCYPESKRMCECLCVSYAHEFGTNVKIVRLAQTFGAGILSTENRVFAQFARSIINNEDIMLHTKGNSEGNYVYTRDAVKAILLLLSKGDKGEAYNISNENCHTTIIDMANMLATDIAKNKIKVVLDIPENSSIYGYAADVKLLLKTDKIKSLGWTPEVGLREAYERMIDDMMEKKQNVVV